MATTDTKLNRKLWLLFSVVAFFIFLIALDKGIYSDYQAGPDLFSLQHQLFGSVCHQDAHRSFWINGQPMAVCTRCFGFYAGFLGIILLMPFLPDFKFKKSTQRTYALFAFFLNVLDVIANAFGWWQNTMWSRFIFGIGIASALLIFFQNMFNHTLFKSKP